MTLTGVLIGPAKPDGRAWDCCANAGATRAAVTGVGKALLGSNPYTAAAAWLAGPIAKGNVPPDPYGTATLFSAGALGAPVKLPRIKDTYNPQWTVRWSNVALQSATRLHVNIWDKDMSNHDPVGAFDINYGHLVNAVRSQVVIQVPVHAQTRKTVLFAGISVVPAR